MKARPLPTPHPVRRLLWAGLGAATVGVACLAAPAGAAPRCPIAHSPVEVTLTADPGTVTWRTRYTRSDLKRMARRLAASGSRASGHPLGLTVAEFRLDMRTSAKVYPLGGGRYCALPVKVDFTVGYPRFVVYVDRRYRPGTCQSRQIRDHETQHVAVYRRQLTRYAPQMRARLVQVAQRMKPVFVSRPEQAVGAVQGPAAAPDRAHPQTPAPCPPTPPTPDWIRVPTTTG